MTDRLEGRNALRRHSHCHLNAEQFAGDADEVMAAAELAGVERILVPGWDAASSGAALALVGRFPRLAGAAVGIHPHAADETDSDAWAQVVALAADPLVVAIGETGLDFDRMWSPRDAQLANLRRNLELPISVRWRRASRRSSTVARSPANGTPRTPSSRSCERPGSVGLPGAPRSGRAHRRSSTRSRGRSTTWRRRWRWAAR